MSCSIRIIIFFIIHLHILSDTTMGFLMPKNGHTSTSSEKCPHGVLYVNACKNLCSCDPSSGGGEMCNKGDCTKPSGLCPFGSLYEDPEWRNYDLDCTCYCNKSESQTYECFKNSRSPSR